MNKQFSDLQSGDIQKHQEVLDKSIDQTPIAKLITNIHRKKEEEATKALAQKLALPYLNLMHYQPEPKAVGLLPKEMVTTGHVFAFKQEGSNVYLAVHDLMNPQSLAILEKIKKQYQYTFIPVLVSQSSMDYLISIYDIFVPKKYERAELKITDTIQASSIKALQDWKNYYDQRPDLPVSELFEIILAGATYYQSSDIHIEPAKTNVQLRFRIDSVLQDIINFPSSYLDAVINRIKILANLKLNITESAQDGRFSITAGDTTYDIRVSVLPTAYGESAVLRLLPQKGKFLSLEQLGLAGHNAEIIEQAIKQPNGLILNTGPTGSGKTTTLYAILDKINSPDKKIITIEDPIEYKMAGITQSQVNPEEGYSFATGLRSILRQDPDVILVGEIRDGETAGIAVNASLTGHLVLSTLHTNDAAGAIPRLADLGMKPAYFIEAILAIIAQRLVRRVCEKCAESYTPSNVERTEIQAELDALPATVDKPTIPATLKRYNPAKAKDCPVCHGLGYKGIIGIFEILQVNEAITKAVLAGQTIGDIKKLAMANGMITLKQEGIIKMLAGITTLEEINRVTGNTILAG